MRGWRLTTKVFYQVKYASVFKNVPLATFYLTTFVPDYRFLHFGSVKGAQVISLTVSR